MDFRFAKRLPFAKPAYLALVRLDGWLSSQRRIAHYLRVQNVKKLHLGCGLRRLAGWLNSDLVPIRYGVVRLDATRRFPLPDAAVDYVFSEHMIEHVPFAQGQVMLAEMFRVLKPGGRLRLSTPKLEFLLALAAEPSQGVEADYVRWASANFGKDLECSGVAVVNNFMRDFGHQFIYDRASLVRALERTGFEAIEPFPIGFSNDPELTGLEAETRMPPGFLALESQIVEARKPRA